MAPFSDNFNRADSTTTLGAPWSTTADNPTGTRTSTWGISSNRAYIVTSPFDSGLGINYAGIAYIDGGASDGTVQVTFAVVSGSPAGLVFRWDAANATGWRLEWNGSSLALSYYNGTWNASGQPNTGSQSVLSAVVASGDVVAVTLAGSSIVVKKNDTTIYTGTSTAGLTSTGFGISAASMFSGAFRFDNFSWAPPASKWTVGYIGFGLGAGTWTPTGLYPATTLYPSTTLYPQGV